ncbi:DUF418 domain-containing protein [Pengzhenrongella sicca]|uniref:DUF418 domain-containing protein n=1 Tax=Pengzhenrongella sicca TaxID=2819238 RepID=A0A8A4ZBS6_9MICO|nr:DUF418 domain-containing protein [Pengzhenrongella sicca]
MSFGAQDVDEVESCGLIFRCGEGGDVDGAAGHGLVADRECVGDGGAGDVDDRTSYVTATFLMIGAGHLPDLPDTDAYTGLLLAAAGILVVQCAFSPLWPRHHRQGPARVAVARRHVVVVGARLTPDRSGTSGVRARPRSRHRWSQGRGHTGRWALGPDRRAPCVRCDRGAGRAVVTRHMPPRPPVSWGVQPFTVPDASEGYERTESKQ